MIKKWAMWNYSLLFQVLAIHKKVNGQLNIIRVNLHLLWIVRKNKEGISSYAWNINNVNYMCREVHVMGRNYAIWVNSILFLTTKLILLLGILWRFQNCVCFSSSVIRYWVLYFWKWAKKKKQENNYKNKTKPKFEKSLRTKCFLFFILRMYAKFHKKSVNK